MNPTFTLIWCTRDHNFLFSFLVDTLHACLLFHCHRLPFPSILCEYLFDSFRFTGNLNGYYWKIRRIISVYMHEITINFESGEFGRQIEKSYIQNCVSRLGFISNSDEIEQVLKYALVFSLTADDVEATTDIATTQIGSPTIWFFVEYPIESFHQQWTAPAFWLNFACFRYFRSWASSECYSVWRMANTRWSKFIQKLCKWCAVSWEPAVHCKTAEFCANN